MSARCRRRRGFTLVELMLVLAIVGVFGGQAVAGFASWKRRASLQEAVASVLVLSRHALAETLFAGRPYQIRFEGSSLAGLRCEPEGRPAVESRFVPDTSAQLPDGVALLEPAQGTVWTLDSGGVLVEPDGEVSRAERWEIVLACSEGGATVSSRVVLQSGGGLRLETPREGQ